MSRQEFQELVGLPKDEAVNTIKQEHSKIMIQILPENSMVTMDYNENRVRIFVDKDDKVVSTPMIG